MWKKALLAVLFAVFLYTRLVGLNWGLPYPLNPDERNMADAVTRLECPNPADLPNCLNPRFFAYGQVPLYLAYAGIHLFHYIFDINITSVSFYEATIALRLISVTASLLTAYVLFLLTRRLAGSIPDNAGRMRRYGPWLAILAFLFSPYGIQSSHFGTTEAVLMLLYSATVYFSLTLAENASSRRASLLLSLALGLSIAIKISSVIFLGLPILILAYRFFLHENERPVVVSTAITLFGLAAIVAVVFSPQTVISWNEFMASFAYESSVATGSYQAFYTRQFTDTIPLFFQIEHIFPYTLGLVAFVIAGSGFFFLTWKNKRFNILRLAILIYLLPTSLLFAKWSRFMAPVFPLMTVFATLFVLRLSALFKRYAWAAIGLIFSLSLLPGIAYLSVYTRPDIRFTASEWIYTHIPPGTKILSETANVIDIPVPPPDYKGTAPSYQYASFDFYHLDEDQSLQTLLRQYIAQADYIFVPSRRIFMNSPASRYPQIQAYYDGLFSGRLGFEKVKELTAYPNISLFGHTLVEFPDEQAEETWTVFDHPVIRIYQKIGAKTVRPDFSGYRTMDYKLQATNYRLLVADTQEKWEKGLMWVRSKADADGYDGMIFLFPDKGIQTFWNKNTVSDLDLYWIDGQKVVGKAVLLSIEKSKVIQTVSSPAPADKVIEIIK